MLQCCAVCLLLHEYSMFETDNCCCLLLFLADQHIRSQQKRARQATCRISQGGSYAGRGRQDYLKLLDKLQRTVQGGVSLGLLVGSLREYLLLSCAMAALLRFRSSQVPRNCHLPLYFLQAAQPWKQLSRALHTSLTMLAALSRHVA